MAPNNRIFENKTSYTIRLEGCSNILMNINNSMTTKNDPYENAIS
ncbi:hypothetical protein [Cellulophaga baltica]|nr:hypothetical protein [Cellulophaga baltica]